MNKIVPRGVKACLSCGGLPEVISEHLQKLIARTGGIKGPIGLQFVAQIEKERKAEGKLDPLLEDKSEVAPGLIYMYRGKKNSRGEIVQYGRVLWTISNSCASYCRFCTRGRKIGVNKPLLSDHEIEKVFKFIKNHNEINEVILSGGDPLFTPREYLEKIIDGLKKLKVSTVRVGTRLPVHAPNLIKEWHYRILKKIEHPYIMLHVNHPEELTDATLRVLKNFREKSGAYIFGQSVMLKGVNDNEKTLHNLFVKEATNGIIPYYLLQNDEPYWTKHFTVPLKKGIALWQKLRPKLSGVAATCRFVIDNPAGGGKVSVPEGGAWKVDYGSFKNFKGKRCLIF